MAYKLDITSRESKEPEFIEALGDPPPVATFAYISKRNPYVLPVLSLVASVVALTAVLIAVTR